MFVLFGVPSVSNHLFPRFVPLPSCLLFPVLCLVVESVEAFVLVSRSSDFLSLFLFLRIHDLLYSTFTFNTLSIYQLSHHPSRSDGGCIIMFPYFLSAATPVVCFCPSALLASFYGIFFSAFPCIDALLHLFRVHFPHFLLRVYDEIITSSFVSICSRTRFLIFRFEEKQNNKRRKNQMRERLQQGNAPLRVFLFCFRFVLSLSLYRS